MNFNEYQKKAMTFDLFDENKKDSSDIFTKAFMAKILGLVGESGEIAEKFKKIIRDKDGIISDEEKEEMIKELGDVLWYVSVLSNYLGFSFEEVALKNIEKLSSRKSRGVLNGSGDNR